MWSSMVEIVVLRPECAVIYKDVGIPSQPDPTGDADAMSITSAMLAERGESSKLWLVHRLDRTVSGLMVFARTEAAARELSRLVAEDKLEKTYLAVAQGNPEGGVYRDFLSKDARLSKAFVVKSARRGVKEAHLDCEPLFTKQERSLCRVSLHTGRYHQIRVQFSSRGTPLVGDGKYGSRDKGARTPALTAYKLAFTLSGERIEAERLPDVSEYPWSLFEAEIKEEFCK